MTDSEQDLQQTIHQISELVERRRIDSARSLLGTVLPKNPDNVDLLEQALWVDWLDDENDAARTTVGHLLELDPDNFAARYALVQLERSVDNFVDAERVLVDLLRDYPENDTLYTVYARIMLETFNIDKAEKLAVEAQRRNPDSLDSMAIQAQCAFIREPGAEQQARLERVLQEHPDQIQTTILLVQRLIDLGKNDQAYELSRTLAVSQPDNPHLIEMADELRYASHWSLKPLWPMQKWGWGASVAIWLGAVIFFRTDVLPGYQGPIAIALIAYVIYSWVWPPILKRLMGVS